MTDYQQFLHGLNQEQLKSVTHYPGSLLVLAGAGSGKTKVLITRIAWLIREHNLAPSEILAVTFTNKAAREMLNRIAKLLQLDVRSMWVGTFHSISLRLLRSNYEIAKLPANFQVIDSSEQQSLIKRLIKSFNFDEDRYPAKEVQNFINYHKEQGTRSAKLAVESIRSQHWLQIYQKYEQECDTQGLVDFTELLLRCYEMLSNNSDLLARYANQFRHVLVDEFQDTNQLQYKWLQLLAAKNNSVFAVGDDDQSIYAFRGAKVSNMRHFLTDFKVREPIRLEQNYRSTQTILAAANAVIGNNSERIGKQLWTNNSLDDQIRLYEGYTEEDEAYFVIDEISNLCKEGIELSEIAILYRSNAQSRVFEQHLYNRGISYKVYGGLRFFDRQEIRRTLDYLRLSINTEDNEAFLRVVNFPARKIGPRSIEILQELAAANNVSLYTATSLLSDKLLSTFANFTQIIQRIQAISKVDSLSATISAVIEFSGIKDHYEHDLREGKERLDNLNELIIAVNDYEPEDQSNPVVDFLAHAVLESGEKQAANYQQAVQLMTVHASKGLEFRVIFLVGLEDGLFPYESSLDNLHTLEEERRLMYVAITRAKQKLYLLRACSRMLWGRRSAAPISRFVSEIPNDLINNISGISKIGYSTLGQYADLSKEDLTNKCSVNHPETKTGHLSPQNQNFTIKIGDMIRPSQIWPR